MSISLIKVSGNSIPEVYEKLLVSAFKDGTNIMTQYDSETDFGSLDVCAAIEIKEPFAEPRIHLRFPGGPGDLEIYRQEVVEGIHDHWVGTKWKYSYHGRLCDYSVFRGKYDQIFGDDGLVEKLVEAPFTRRAQGITWVPYDDPKYNDPPCLQRVWARIIDDKLQFHTHWRSRDLWKAWFMNVYALTDWQRIIAGEISKRLGKEIGVGSYIEMIDSLHVYGKDREEFVKEVNKIMSKKQDYTSRSWRSDDERVVGAIEEARERLAKDSDFMLTGAI